MSTQPLARSPVTRWLPDRWPVIRHKAIRLSGLALFRTILFSWICCLIHATNQVAPPDSENPVKQLTLQQLGEVEITTASREPEQVWRTPAAVYVLTREDILRSGVTTIPAALRLVPGV